MTKSSIELPELSLEPLKRLTDDTGRFQHTRYTIPYREDGYCTDNNARALIVVTKYYALHTEPEALELFNTYLSFILHSQNSDGSVRNSMNFDRTWLKDEPGTDINDLEEMALTWLDCNNPCDPLCGE